MTEPATPPAKGDPNQNPIPDAAPAAGVAPAAPADPDPAPAGDGDEKVVEGADRPDAVRNALAAERAKAKQAEARAKAAEATVKQFEDRDKTEQQKLAERAETAEKAAADAEARLLRLTVGAEKGLPAALAERLQGTTEEEMAADADRLLEAVKPGRPDPASLGGHLNGGARGTDPAPSLDQQIAAAEAKGDWQAVQDLNVRKLATVQNPNH